MPWLAAAILVLGLPRGAAACDTPDFKLTGKYDSGHDRIDWTWEAVATSGQGYYLTFCGSDGFNGASCCPGTHVPLLDGPSNVVKFTQVRPFGRRECMEISAHDAQGNEFASSNEACVITPCPTQHTTSSSSTSSTMCEDPARSTTTTTVVATCGNSVVESGEQCDDGDTKYAAGDYCSAGCDSIPCGHPTSPGAELPKARDALFILRTAVGLGTCDVRVCDVNGSGAVTAADSLSVLRKAVGGSVSFACPH